MFFKKVQNKIHYAIHGQTAAEVIYNRADAEKELHAMGQLVSGYLDFAERQAEREQAMTMRDWAEHLDRILVVPRYAFKSVPCNSRSAALPFLHYFRVLL